MSKQLEPWPVGTRVVFVGPPEPLFRICQRGEVIGVLRPGYEFTTAETHLDLVMLCTANLVQFDGLSEESIVLPMELRPIEDPDPQTVVEHDEAVTA